MSTDTKISHVHCVSRLHTSCMTFSIAPCGMTVNGCLEAFGQIEKVLCREYGLFQFPSTSNAYNETSADERVIEFLLNERDHERVLDVVEVSFGMLEFLVLPHYLWANPRTESEEEAGQKTPGSVVFLSPGPPL